MDAGPGLSCNIRRPGMVSYTSAYTATPCADTSITSPKPIGDATHPYCGLCYRLLPHQRDQAFVYLCLWQAQRLDDFCHYARERQFRRTTQQESAEDGTYFVDLADCPSGVREHVPSSVVRSVCESVPCISRLERNEPDRILGTRWVTYRRWR